MAKKSAEKRDNQAVVLEDKTPASLANKANLRTWINNAGACANEIITALRKKTSIGMTLDDAEIDNFKLAFGALKTIRELTFEGKRVAAEGAKGGDDAGKGAANPLASLSGQEIMQLASTLRPGASKESVQ